MQNRGKRQEEIKENRVWIHLVTDNTESKEKRKVLPSNIDGTKKRVYEILQKLKNKTSTLTQRFWKFALISENEWSYPFYTILDLFNPENPIVVSWYSQIEVFPTYNGYLIKAGNFYAGNPSMYRDVFFISNSWERKKVGFYSKDIETNNLDSENQDAVFYLWDDKKIYISIDSSRRKDPSNKSQPRELLQEFFEFKKDGTTQKVNIPQNTLRNLKSL